MYSSSAKKTTSTTAFYYPPETKLQLGPQSSFMPIGTEMEYTITRLEFPYSEGAALYLVQGSSVLMKILPVMSQKEITNLQICLRQTDQTRLVNSSSVNITLYAVIQNSEIAKEGSLAATLIKTPARHDYFSYNNPKLLRFYGREYHLMVDSIADRLYIPLANQIIDQRESIQKLIDRKQRAMDQALKRATDYEYITKLEFILSQAFPNPNNEKIGLDEYPHKCSIDGDGMFKDITHNIDLANVLLKELTTESDLDIIKLPRCERHYFHIGCLKGIKMKTQDYIRCPQCQTVYGVMKGDQPYGTIKTFVNYKIKLPGFEAFDTIVIWYDIAGGPGFTGINRQTFLPNSLEGQKVCKMLELAFKRRLIFTLGNGDAVTFADGITHKTNISGGADNFGFPDPDYLERIQRELAAKGVVLDDD